MRSLSDWCFAVGKADLALQMSHLPQYAGECSSTTISQRSKVRLLLSQRCAKNNQTNAPGLGTQPRTFHDYFRAGQSRTIIRGPLDSTSFLTSSFVWAVSFVKSFLLSLLYHSDVLIKGIPLKNLLLGVSCNLCNWHSGIPIMCEHLDLTKLVSIFLSNRVSQSLALLSALRAGSLSSAWNL